MNMLISESLVEHSRLLVSSPPRLLASSPPRLRASSPHLSPSMWCRNRFRPAIFEDVTVPNMHVQNKRISARELKINESETLIYVYICICTFIGCNSCFRGRTSLFVSPLVKCSSALLTTLFNGFSLNAVVCNVSLLSLCLSFTFIISRTFRAVLFFWCLSFIYRPIFLQPSRAQKCSKPCTQVSSNSRTLELDLCVDIPDGGASNILQIF